jgi:hypothetical protein
MPTYVLPSEPRSRIIEPFVIYTFSKQSVSVELSRTWRRLFDQNFLPQIAPTLLQALPDLLGSAPLFEFFKLVGNDNIIPAKRI